LCELGFGGEERETKGKMNYGLKCENREEKEVN